jgi:hypothetical protein
MTKGVASVLPRVMPLLGAEQSHCFGKGNVRQTPHVRSEFSGPRRIYQLGFNLSTRNCPAIAV